MTIRRFLLCLVIAVAAPAFAGDDPAAARLALFLDAHGQQSGLPDAATARALREHVSARLAADLAVAAVAQAEFIAAHPDENPPLVEGPLFNSTGYEPYTGYTIVAGPAGAGEPGADGDRRVLRVRFTDDPVTPVLAWEDAFALVHEHGAWRVDDVAYRGGFGFGNHGTLRGALYGEGEPAPTDDATPATPAGDAAPPPADARD